MLQSNVSKLCKSYLEKKPTTFKDSIDTYTCTQVVLSTLDAYITSVGTEVVGYCRDPY